MALKTPEPNTSRRNILSREVREKYLGDLNLKEEDLKRFLDKQKKKAKEIEFEKPYTIYKSSGYAKYANSVLGKRANALMVDHPDFFDPLFKSLREANIKILKRTYVSILLFSTIIAFPIGAIAAFFLTFNIMTTILVAILAPLLTFAIIYYYPASVINQRKRKLKLDLVFGTVHMSAIAGSGAQPTEIFRLVVESKEYKELESDVKKVLNYMNLFGYNLTTALKNVAMESPSYELKELFNGMVGTIETGGSLRDYLREKADDALNQYKLDQTKYLSALSTYSDIYTGILVAAPLLFIVTFAILDKIAPTLGGMSIKSIALIGTFGALPVINIAFILFLSVTQSDL